jgi:hypothetical protein
MCALSGACPTAPHGDGWDRHCVRGFVRPSHANTGRPISRRMGPALCQRICSSFTREHRTPHISSIDKSLRGYGRLSALETATATAGSLSLAFLAFEGPAWRRLLFQAAPLAALRPLVDAGVASQLELGVRELEALGDVGPLAEAALLVRLRTGRAGARAA